MHKSLSLYAQSYMQTLSFVADRPCINDVFVLLVVYVTRYMMPESLSECFDTKNWKLAVYEADVSSAHACNAGTKLKSPLQSLSKIHFTAVISFMTRLLSKCTVSVASYFLCVML